MGTRSQLSNGLVAVARGMKTPAPQRFSCGSVERLAAGAAVDLHFFGSTVLVDEHAEQHSTFAALAAGAVRIVRPRCVAITRLDQTNGSG